MKKRTTIIGMRLECKSCGVRFAIGKLGIEAVRERCLEHIRLKGCGPEVIPVNAPKGLTYVGNGGEPKVVYDGEDFDAFWESVKITAMEHRTTMSPKLELTT